MNSSTVPLYATAQVRELDRVAIEEFNIPGYTLMTRAGTAVLHVLRERWPEAKRIAILCGAGNNGGDGFVTARLARAAGLEAVVMQLGDPAGMRGDAATAAADARADGIAAQPFDASRLNDMELIIDALLGTGLERQVEGDWRQAIEAVNHCPAPVLAVDIPSGLNGDTGNPMGCAVRADATVSFIGRKRGLYTGSGPEFGGVAEFDSLQVPRGVFDRVAAAAELMARAPLGSLASPRPRDAHKGMFGHVLVIGGDHGMAGAARLAGEAAARSGAGLVSVATRAVHAPGIAAARPELMCHAVESAADLQPLLKRATVVAIGPGLGKTAWGNQLLGAALDSGRPLVVDADALNLMGGDAAGQSPRVLTPHPGEAARLLRTSTADVQQDRFAAVVEIARRYRAVCVLKGCGSLIAAAEGPVAVCPSGNAGMASGGMGDVLSGVIAAFLAQGLAAGDAARAGVFVHGRAGDLAAREGERGLLASDLLAWLRAAVNS